jgi:hypothetical protein
LTEGGGHSYQDVVNACVLAKQGKDAEESDLQMLNILEHSLLEKPLEKLSSIGRAVHKVSI